MKATKWILSTSQLSYRTRLLRLSLLPLSMYHEMHVLLVFIDIVRGRYNIEWKRFVDISERQVSQTRNSEIKIFKTRKLMKQKQESDFWTGGVYLANLFGRIFGVSVDEVSHPKSKIMEVYKSLFEKAFQEDGICSWRRTCLCSNCRNLIKLK